MKRLLISGSLLLVTLFLRTDLWAQGKERGTEVSANASQIFFELGGPGIIYSFNYDGRFGGYENGIGFRVGIGGAYWNGDGYIALPVQLNYLLGTNGKYFEIGAGVTYAPGLNLFGTDNNPDIPGNQYTNTYGTFTMGFRKQPLGKKGFTWRAAFSPIIGFSAGGSFLPFVGFSWGYRF
ncbi:MAG: hypothetical protein ACHQEM_09665 [Chitinophagales bacterium]